MFYISLCIWFQSGLQVSFCSSKSNIGIAKCGLLQVNRRKCRFYLLNLGSFHVICLPSLNSFSISDWRIQTPTYYFYLPSSIRCSRFLSLKSTLTTNWCIISSKRCMSNEVMLHVLLSWIRIGYRCRICLHKVQKQARCHVYTFLHCFSLELILLS